MSRTRKGSKACGTEFWGKYRCDKYGAAGVGAYAKWKANIERRMDTKELVDGAFQVTKEELDEICRKGEEIILNTPFDENKVFVLWEG